jgi:RNA polymerase sigma-70 factor, ECF subfamily
VLRHREDAEDVAQEAFVRAHRSFRQLRDRDRFRAWLVRLTWRLAIDRRRADRRRAGRDAAHVREAARPALAAHGGAMDDAIVARERANLLWEAIDALPEKLRVVVVLSAIEEQDVREVARLLDLPEGTIKSRLFAARSRMRAWLQCARKT